MPTIILCYPADSREIAQLPIGLYKIASYCQYKYNVHIVDGRIKDPFSTIQKILENEHVIFLGLSVMTGPQIHSALNISKFFHGKIPIVWGGLHPTILPEQTLENEFIDYIVVGEGEYQAYDLANKLLKNDNMYPPLKGYNEAPFSYKKFEHFADKGSLPYKGIDIQSDYFVSRDGIETVQSLETSRGCPHSCKFCHNSTISSKIRLCSSMDITQSIQWLKNKYSIKGIIFQEDNFFCDNKRVNEVLKFLSHDKVLWKANTRVSYVLDKIKFNLLSKSLDSGCKVLQLGIESGNDKILRFIGKKITVDDILKANIKLSKLKLKIRYNFIIGFPNETEKEIKDTLSLIDRLRNDNQYMTDPFVNIYTPYPKTKLYSDALVSGFVPPQKLSEWGNLYWNKPSETMHSDLFDFLCEISNNFLKKNDYSKFLKGSFHDKA